VFSTSSDGGIRVKKCVAGGPADASQAIKPGDILLKIDGCSCVGLSIRDIQPKVCAAVFYNWVLLCFG
jgi:C-terminal processing protease CtpA/Prc